MKKKKILQRLKTIISGLALDRIPCDIRDEIAKLIKDIQTDIKPERKYLTSLEAVTKLLNGEAARITNEEAVMGEYAALHFGALTWFRHDGSLYTYRVNLKTNMKWWVVE